MSTNRDMVSRVRSTHKLLGDASITDRAILAELNSMARTLIKQQTDKRKLWNTSTIFTTIPCLEMVEVPLAECCDYVSDITISRSKNRLPKMGEGNYGLLIQGVFSVDGGRKLNESTATRYANTLKLRLNRSSIYYWVQDGFIYVSSPNITLIKVIAYFEEDVPEDILNPDCNCFSQLKEDLCKNPLDREFKCPGTLETTVVTGVSNFLLQTYFRIQNDQTSDAKDDQTNKA